jgi:cellulose synthase/poly-beta-1,6-N-acetylglucosamine synthase-like glycosyltransferase
MTSTVSIALGAVLAVSLAAVAYTYLVYPAVVYALGRLFGRAADPAEPADADLPTVTLLVAAFNEEGEIEARVRNALAVDYPAGKFEVVIASDGSSDRTAAVAGGFADRRVRVLDFPQRRGKSAVLNDALANHVRSEVVVLSDANTANDPRSVRRLARWFQDPAVGVVCGKLVLTDPAGSTNLDGVYWRYETFLKECESRLGALLGSNGGIYAVRRSAYTPIPDNTLVDDFVIPLVARQRTGCRIVYDRSAVAYEETPAEMTAEFHRRARIGAGGFQALGILKGLLHPRHGWVAFTFASHKLLRWVCPFCLLLAFGCSLALAPWHPLALALLVAQAAFYGLALAAPWLPARPGPLMKVLRLPAMFAYMNAALFVGFLRWAGGPGNGTWRRTARTGPAGRPAPTPPPAATAGRN